MTAQIPLLLTTADFSDPEMQIMVRDGILRRVGPWYSPIAVPDTTGLRARGVFSQFGTSVIADTYTAAWIYKCATRLAEPLTGSMPRRERSASARKLGRVREVPITDEEVWLVGRLRITSPERTFRDFGRVVHQKGEAHHALREEVRGRLIAATIAVMFRLDMEAEQEALDALGQAPYSRRSSIMLEQVRNLLSQISHLDREKQLQVLVSEQSKLPGFLLH